MIQKKISVLITGATGMVGEGVLHQCLQRLEVEKVLVINRRPCGVVHTKLKEIIHEDFFDFSPIENQLLGYNVCFFCLGVTSLRKTEAIYYKYTYALTLHVATTLCKINKEMTFCYISGTGTDSSEAGKIMWARVKGKTENALMSLPFEQVFAFRPGFIKPIAGLKNAHKFYRYVNWLFPIGRMLSPKTFCTLAELGDAMINSIQLPQERKIFEGKDIIELAKQ